MIATALAIVGSAVAAGEQGRVGLLFPSQWQPDNIVASVVHVEPNAITYALACPSSAGDDCSILMPTMTQGPRTWAYRGEWEDIQGVDEYTMNNDCAVNTKDDKMVCTTGVTQVKGGRTASTEIVETITSLEGSVHPIPITAGIEKLDGDKPKPTQTSQTPTSTPSSTTTSSSTAGPTMSAVSLPTVLPTVNMAAADATKDAAAELPTTVPEGESEDGIDAIEATPSVVPTAAASVSRVQGVVVGLVALVGGMLML